ncbi:hypothetical protein T492DRAFT_888620, partial [Pavlovales sp. CCMP2436]
PAGGARVRHQHGGVSAPADATGPGAAAAADRLAARAFGTSTAVSQRLLDATGPNAVEEAGQLAARACGTSTAVPQRLLDATDPEAAAAAEQLVARARGTSTAWMPALHKALDEAAYELGAPQAAPDVPYQGTVTSLKKEGLAVRFDGSPDEEEVITNDDEWLWGEHKKKSKVRASSSTLLVS